MLFRSLAAALGHSLTAPIVPALVPLVLPVGHWITELSGLTLPAEVAWQRVDPASGTLLPADCPNGVTLPIHHNTPLALASDCAPTASAPASGGILDRLQEIFH